MHKRLFSLLLCIVIIAGLFTSQAFADDVAPPETDEAPAPEISVVNTDEFIAIIDSLLEENGLAGKDKVSVGFEYTKTGETAFYNGDAWYYTASLFKLPLGMMLAHDVMNGEDPTGTYAGGVDNVQWEMLVHSANKISYTVASFYYGWDKVRQNEMALSGWSEDELPERFLKATSYQEYSCRFLTSILEELYFNADQYPGVIDLLKEASPGEFLKKNDLDIPVAQKYGAFSENNTIVDHITGIVYTDTPILVTVLTKNIGYNSASALSGKICEQLVAYTKELDAAYDEELRAYEESIAAQQPPEVTETPYEEPVPSPEAPVITPEPEESEASYGLSPVLCFVLVCVLCAAVVILIVMNNNKKRKVNSRHLRR